MVLALEKLKIIKYLSKAIAETQSITTLNFGLLKTENMRYLLECLSKNNTIRILDLSSNFVGISEVEDMRNLSEGLAKNKTISTLNLSDNYLVKAYSRKYDIFISSFNNKPDNNYFEFEYE